MYNYSSPQQQTNRQNFSSFLFKMLSISFNPYTLDGIKERVGSDVITLKLKNNKRELIEVSNLSEDIVIVTPLKPDENFTKKANYFTRNDNLLFHEIDVRFKKHMADAGNQTSSSNHKYVCLYAFWSAADNSRLRPQCHYLS